MKWPRCLNLRCDVDRGDFSAVGANDMARVEMSAQRQEGEDPRTRQTCLMVTSKQPNSSTVSVKSEEEFENIDHSEVESSGRATEHVPPSESAAGLRPAQYHLKTLLKKLKQTDTCHPIICFYSSQKYTRLLCKKIKFERLVPYISPIFHTPATGFDRKQGTEAAPASPPSQKCTMEPISAMPYIYIGAMKKV